MSYILLSKQNDTVGVDKYRDEVNGTPLGYRPSMNHTVNRNADGSNHTVTLKVSVPVVKVVEGVTTSDDTFIATAKFTALQNIVSNDERAKAYDDMITWLIVLRNSNLEGQLPFEAPTKFAAVREALDALIANA